MVNGENNRSLELRLKIQEIRQNITDREREREREQKLLNGLYGGMGFLIFFDIVTYLGGKEEGNWLPFILLSILTGLILIWVFRRISKTSKLSKEIENYKKQIKNLENSIR